jgi:phage repressor protein C with HTH and peptisase S24 domain
MDEFGFCERSLAKLVVAHLDANPALFAEHEAMAAWLVRDAKTRAGAHERRLTAEIAADVASTVARTLITRRLEKEYPRAALVTKPATRTGRADVVREVARAERSAPLLDMGVAAGSGRDIFDESIDTWVTIPAAAPKGDYVALPVTGESMMPFLHPRDVVLVKLGSEANVDDVIVARRDEGYVVKHVSAVTKREIELSSLDPSWPKVRIPRGERRVVGTVIARMRTA